MFKNFYENEDFEKENKLADEEIKFLKDAGFKTSKDHKTAMKKISDDFTIDVSTDHEITKLELRMTSITPEIKIAKSEFKYLDKKAITAFVFYSESLIQSAERLKNLGSATVA